jgi:sugar phosphate isomerase/epimerase
VTPATPRLGLTLFSFTREFWLRQWTLDKCLRRAGELGDGIALEIVGAQSLPHYPSLSPEDERDLRKAFDRYNLIPTCYGAHVERGRVPGRVASLDETVAIIDHEIDIAVRLGFPLVRLQTATSAILERLVPAAERADVRVVVELHARPIETPEMQEVLALMDRLQTPHLGFIFDFGATMTRVPAAYLEVGRREGVPESVIEFTRDAWEGGVTLDDALVALAHAASPPEALAWVRPCWSMFHRTDPSTIDPTLPHLAHVHAKFFGIDDHGEEPTIPYDLVLARLRDGGYEAALSSEYLSWRAAGETDSFDQVRAHHAMMRRLWAAGTEAVA